MIFKKCGITVVFKMSGITVVLTKDIWKELWRIATGDDSKKRWGVMEHMQRVWSTKLLRGSTSFSEEIWVEMWDKIWDMQQVWSTVLQRDSVSLVKEIWEEMWNMDEVRSTKLLSDTHLLPTEIWKLQQLRHLRIVGRNLPDPSDGTRLQYLSTLYVNAQSCTYSVFKSIPRLRKLGVKIELRPDVAETLNCFKHIWRLHGLDRLKCMVVNPQQMPHVVAPPHHLSDLTFLRMFSLNGSGYGWECMSVIGHLPGLKVLKLRCSAVRGPVWEARVLEFTSLEYLLLEDIDLVRWETVENGWFPHLEHLIIRHCYKLKKLPGSIKSLKTEVVDCSPSVVAYAQQIKDASPSVEVLITSTWKLRR